jgi:hypothetical protein
MLGVTTVFATISKHEAELIIVRADLEWKQGRRAGTRCFGRRKRIRLFAALCEAQRPFALFQVGIKDIPL